MEPSSPPSPPQPPTDLSLVADGVTSVVRYRWQLCTGGNLTHGGRQPASTFN